MAIKDTPYRYMTVHGLTGYGYLIEYAGKLMHSIAWPNKPGERMMEDELSENGIHFSPLTESPDETDEAKTNSETEAVESSEESASADKETSAAEPIPFVFDKSDTEANNIRNYITSNPEASNQEVIAGLNTFGMEVSAGQVSYNRKRLADLKTTEEDTADDQVPISESELKGV